MKLPVCQVCHVRSIAKYNPVTKNHEDIPMTELKGTVIKDGFMFCGSCWCKKHNGPKPSYGTFCLICYPEKKN